MNDSAPSSTRVLAIEMQDVAVGQLRDQSHIVVEGVHWSVAAGEYWVVAGLQGSGKSDFLLMTAGLMAPAGGSYRLFGEPMPIFEDARVLARLRLGVVFESSQLFNHLTVRENVALPLRYHRNLTQAESFSEVQQVLETLGLEPWADSTPGTLSRGWQKRVGLARALILRPEVLLVDDPLAGLDLRHANWWTAFLGELSKGHALLGSRPLTLVVTTADLRPWRGQRCRFAMIRDHRLVTLGDWSQLQAVTHGLVSELLMAEARKP